MALTERAQVIPNFERGRWTEAGVEETAIRGRFARSGTRSHHILHELTGSTDAMVYAPLIIRRLRPAHELRRRDRDGRRAGVGRSVR